MESDYCADGWYVFALFEWIRDGFGGCSRVIVAGWWRGWELCSELGSFGSTEIIERHASGVWGVRVKKEFFTETRSHICYIVL
uniref:Uncharacterized protein n=1 Tax=Candidatus Methanogaster sp. ANME-2c ERB4 TaxID=2759911 RepID=A0A7G9YF56_9EURY|nr:hypothetical protein OEAKOMNL_00042 [Methanosarcinales archaeon ANME-2c ERB4]